jgi:GNAT superfamily N-acetyltransferase
MFSVRCAAFGDASSVADFFRSNATLHVDSGLCYETYIESIIKQSSKLSIIALNNEPNSTGLHATVGYLSLDLMQRPRGGIVAYLGEVLVADDHRRLGIGSMMVKFGLDQALKLGSHRVILNASVERLAFYRRLGFEDWEIALRIDL